MIIIKISVTLIGKLSDKSIKWVYFEIKLLLSACFTRIHLFIHPFELFIDSGSIKTLKSIKIPKRFHRFRSIDRSITVSIGIPHKNYQRMQFVNILIDIYIQLTYFYCPHTSFPISLKYFYINFIILSHFNLFWK